jgi:hypothetical protein
MNRAFIARWTRMPGSIGRLSASGPSHHSLSSTAFIINIAESDFRDTHPAVSAVHVAGTQSTDPVHPLGAPWPPRSIQGKMLIAVSESRKPRRNSVRYPVNAG